MGLFCCDMNNEHRWSSVENWTFHSPVWLAFHFGLKGNGTNCCWRNLQQLPYNARMLRGHLKFIIQQTLVGYHHSTLFISDYNLLLFMGRWIHKGAHIRCWLSAIDLNIYTGSVQVQRVWSDSILPELKGIVGNPTLCVVFRFVL